MDLDPFEPVGLSARTARFLDVFLLHCLLSDSPPDSPQEIAALAGNQQLTAARGREPGLALQRDGEAVLLVDWAAQILAECAPIAEALDALNGGDAHRAALQSARAGVAAPDSLPSARVLAEMTTHHGGSHTGFVEARAEATRQTITALPWSAESAGSFDALAAQSVRDQAAIEAGDSLPFEIYRQEYLAPRRLGAGLVPPG